MAQSRVYVGIIQPLDYTPFEGNDGKAIFAKGLEEAGEVEQRQIERGRISTGGVDEC